MCGIICEFCFSKAIVKDEKILHRINNRGPDCLHSLEFNINETMKAYFYGAVLWMQGVKLLKQPVENNQGVLLFNGDIYDDTWDNRTSDTQIIMEKITEAKNRLSEESIINEIKSFKGPFSLIYYDKLTNDLYFTRDKIGRTTLLFHKNDNSLVISSVLSRKYKCIEIPATHIHRLNIESKKIKLYPWSDGLSSEYCLQEWLDKLEALQSLPDEQFVINCDLDIDLKSKNDIVKYIEITAQETKCKLTAMKLFLNHKFIKDTVIRITNLLEKSIKIRLQKQPSLCKICVHNKIQTCIHCTVGILFSGGLDCTILASLADKYTPKEQKIDLINVAFKKEDNATYYVPDRLTGRQSFEELKRLYPSRMWVFKEVNVSKEELENNQITSIGDLVYPRQTILDESIGSALWFAARAQADNGTSPCRVLLLGSGADELFGGYTRHRNSFKRHGWAGLNKELLLDWQRISFRNLARDNRVICDHGRQPRMPYLDEDFTEFVLQLPPWLKCFPSESLGPGIGDKLMLRLVAFNLGLTEAVTLPKRALQFGSRIANKKEKGSDLSKMFVKIK